jgi:3-oxoacyl-(acyl-carrier-protein) synthase
MTAAVTGVGIIGPLGCTAPAFLRAWETGQSAPRIRLPELARTPLEDQTVGALPAFDAGERLGGRRMLKYMSEAAVLGCIAAREALRQANAARRFAPDRIGLYAGTGLAAAKVADIQATLERSLDETGRFSCRRFGEDGLAATNPLLSFKILANMPACLVSIMEGIRGRT